MCNEIEIFEGHSINIILTKFDVDDTTDAETPVDFTGTITATLFTDPARTREAMTFSGNTEVSKSGNEVVLFKAKGDNDLKPNDYFLSVYNDIDADNSYPEMQIPVTVSPSRQPT